MFTFVLRRLTSGVILVFVISAVSYTLLYLGGGNIARRLLGQTATQATVAAKFHVLGLDRPLPVQYFDWLGHAVAGDLGSSWFTGQFVTTAVISRLAVTLSLVFGATVITAIVSVVLGVWAALRPGLGDRIVQFFTILGFAIPGFLVALGLVVLFALQLKLFKPTGYVDFADSPLGWLQSVTLPIIALTVAGVAGVTQQVRGSVLDALRQDYVRTLRSRGLSRRRVIFKHVLRNAGGPALSVLSVQFIGLVGGAVIIEQVFAIPGLGQVAVSATTQGDIPLVMGLVVSTAVIVVIVNLLIDLLQGWLNPKVRMS